MLDMATYYTVEEVAKELRISVETVRRLIKRKELTAISVGGVYRIPAEEYERFVEKRRTNKPEEK